MRLVEREAGLIKLIAQYRDEECRQRLEQARARASALLREVYRRERAYLHEQIEAERQRTRNRIEAARADHRTRLRRRGERAEAQLLAATWPRLRAALLARWGSASGRRGWVEHALRLAGAMLPVPGAGEHWVVHHAPEWIAAERQAVSAALELGLTRQPRFHADRDLVAGVTIACGGALLDASLAGLLRDRPRLEARLLALLATSQSPDAAGSREIAAGPALARGGAHE